MSPRTLYQLWCYYETEGVWRMEGIFREPEEAEAELARLRADVNTPSMPDWWIVSVQGWD